LFCAEETFKGFTKSESSNAKNGAEVLISFDAESRDEVDETARKVFDAGGTIFGEPAEIQGWMYGFAFSDLDGHRWNQVFMDFTKMNEQ
jgi:predicted lactoylglutathione lyase